MPSHGGFKVGDKLFYRGQPVVVIWLSLQFDNVVRVVWDAPNELLLFDCNNEFNVNVDRLHRAMDRAAYACMAEADMLEVRERS